MQPSQYVMGLVLNSSHPFPVGEVCGWGFLFGERYFKDLSSFGVDCREGSRFC